MTPLLDRRIKLKVASTSFQEWTKKAEEGTYKLIAPETQSFELKLISRICCDVFSVRCLEFFLPTSLAECAVHVYVKSCSTYICLHFK